MSGLLKSCVFVLATVNFLNVSGFLKTGEFYVIVDSLDNHPEISREFADWHFSLRRINKTVKVIDGYFAPKKDLVRPRVQGEAYLYTMNKFVKININGPMQGNCEDLINSFLKAYFEGNATWTDDCVIKPGYLQTRKETPINLDDIAHTIYTKTFYKTFKIIATMYNEADEVIMMVSWVLSTKEKE